MLWAKCNHPNEPTLNTALQLWGWFRAVKKAAFRVQTRKQENQKNLEEKCGRMTHTGLDHCLGLLWGARCNVGQSPGCLELERRAAGERDTDEAVRVKRSRMTPLYCRVYLSSLSRQFTSLGRMPDLMRSSMGGLRSLDSSFLGKISESKGS